MIKVFFLKILVLFIIISYIYELFYKNMIILQIFPK